MSGNKSDWTSGTYLQPNFCQSYFGTTPTTGHNHTGADSSASAPQIALSDSVSDYTTGNVVMRVEVPFADIQQDFTCVFERIANTCTISMPDGIYVHSTANDKMRVSPAAGSWPSAILPSNAKVIGGLWVTKETDEPGGPFRLGGLGISTDATASWNCYIDSSGYLSLSDWGFNATGPKGLSNQSFTYYVD